MGAKAVVCDMEAEDDLSSYVDGADAMVFAAGAGPGSGAERKETVDLGAAVKLIAAAGARWSAALRDGQRHRRASDGRGAGRHAALLRWRRRRPTPTLERAGLDYTIVRPGGLTDDPGTGKVTVAPELPRGGQIPREDVAAVLLAVLDEPKTVGKSFDLVGGDTPVEEAVRAL